MPTKKGAHYEIYEKALFCTFALGLLLSMLIVLSPVRAQAAQADGWLQLNGKWYAFDALYGNMITGWKTIDGKRCYFDKDGHYKK